MARAAICDKCGKVINALNEYWVGVQFLKRPLRGGSHSYELITKDMDYCEECFKEIEKNFPSNSED